jgi:hypothetical protein
MCETCAAPAERCPKCRQHRSRRHREARRRVQIMARLRLVTDRKLGKVSPRWVVRLAAENPHQGARGRVQ